jgi:hypothetical protein
MGGTGTGGSRKAVIMIYLPGGPPHQDTFDLKPDAPSEVRGEFKPIRTNVPGIEICEHLPRLARIADKLAIVRSISDAVDDHSDFMCMTGRRKQNQPPGGWPTFGATVSKVLGGTSRAIPPFVGLEPRMQHRPYNAASPGFLGAAHNSFRPEAEGKSDMVLNGITVDRLADRRTLLASFDRYRREVDASGLMAGMDAFQQQALGVLTSSKLLQALDVSKEDPKLRERYGKGDLKVHGDAAPMINEQFLVARRLVYGKTLAGEHRLIDRRFSFDYDAVNRNSLAWAHLNYVARRDFLDLDFVLATIADDSRCFRLELYESLNRL